MAELLKKEREFVMPGDELVKSMDFLPGRNTFREGDSIYSKRLGVVNLNGRVVSVIPLNIVYMPKVNDMVLGKIEEVQPNGWVVDINSANTAWLPLSGVREFIDTKSDLTRYYDIGDMIYGKIAQVSQGSVHISMQDPRARKLKAGRIVKLNPAKIPRLIGKAGSMVNVIKKYTDCRINIGQNGLIWIDDGNQELFLRALKLIEDETFTEGLTDKVTELLGGKS